MTRILNSMLDLCDMDEIHPGLWLGALPVQGAHVAEAQFSLLVLCAREYQPAAELFPGVRVIHAPNLDTGDPPSRQQLKAAWYAAKVVTHALRANEKVLVTCWGGVNRSALVTGIALHQYLGISGLDACAMIRKGRPGTLTNTEFVKCLARIPARA